MNKGSEWLFGDGGLHLGEAADHHAGLVGQGEGLAQIGPHGVGDVGCEGRRGRHLVLECPAEEPALDGLLHHVLKTANWWAKWAEPTKKLAGKLPEKFRTSFVRSALIIKSQVDKHGAVIASTDTTMLNYERDAYAYCWPRDAAYVLWPLMRIGYTDELLKFFAFARRSLNEDGYLGHKYQADGALGSSWHPRVSEGGLVTPPIQTDETALVLFLFGQYYRLHTEPELLASFYTMLVKPMANFLSGYVDENGLPLPSYDLWEEKHLSTTYTASVTYAALVEAAYLAEQIHDDESSIRWREAADAMLARRDTYWDEKAQYFVKGFVDGKKPETFDHTIDSSSLFGIFMFGYYDINDAKVTAAYETLKRTLMSDETKVIRYENDMYRRGDGEPSNPWPVTSLWAAQYALEKGDKAQADRVLDWVQAAMFPSGVIAEQYDMSNEPLSVAPLTWSQAEYMNVLLDMITAPGGASLSSPTRLASFSVRKRLSFANSPNTTTWSTLAASTKRTMINASFAASRCRDFTLTTITASVPCMATMSYCSAGLIVSSKPTQHERKNTAGYLCSLIYAATMTTPTSLSTADITTSCFTKRCSSSLLVS